MEDCVEWHMSRQPSGYGQTWDGKNVVFAHRVAWEREHGPIPKGMIVHHRCHNRGCVNVAHLELLRRDDHGGALGHGKLTREQAREIRRLVREGRRRHRDIAAEFGVSDGMVCMIGSGKRWAAA